MDEEERFEELMLFEKSREKWGLRSQILMCAEEAGELAVATLHLERQVKDKSKSWESFAEEIADVEFMIAEMKHYFPRIQDKIDKYRAEKRKYLRGLLKLKDT